MLSGLVVVYGIIAIALGIEDIVVYVRLSRVHRVWTYAVADCGDSERYVRHYAAG